MGTNIPPARYGVGGVLPHITPRKEIDIIERHDDCHVDCHVDSYVIRRFQEPKAYIITSNRGRRYLAFAGSVEHQNAIMFGYEMKPLYE